RRLSLPPLAPTPTSSLSLHDALPIYEVDLVGCLVVCDPGADVLDQSPGQLIPRYGCCGGLDDGTHRFAHFRIGYADHGDIEDRGVQCQYCLDLGGVDVHPTGYDHEALAVGEKQVPVLVDVAEVTDRRPGRVVRMLCRAGLLRGIEILERNLVAFEIDGPDLAAA